jgi:hypothetical protein
MYTFISFFSLLLTSLHGNMGYLAEFTRIENRCTLDVPQAKIAERSFAEKGPMLGKK